jgi:hypothetical protein
MMFIDLPCRCCNLFGDQNSWNKFTGSEYRNDNNETVIQNSIIK